MNELKLLKTQYLSQKFTIDVQELKLEAQQKMVDKHEQTINALLLNLKMQQANLSEKKCVVGHDILSLFKYYFLEDIIARIYPALNSWNKFTSEWASKETEVSKFIRIDKSDFVDPIDIEEHEIIHNFINPIKKSLQQSFGFELKLSTLRKISTDRHEVAHTDLRSALNQRAFINKCKSYQFPEEYAFTEVLQRILGIIDKLDGSKRVN